MTSATFSAMSNMLKALKIPSTSRVIEHGLFAGVVLVLMNAAVTLEALEITTGMIGALAVWFMKENASRKCQKGCPDSLPGCKIAPRLCKDEPSTQLGFTDDTPPHDAEIAQLKACVQAELNVLRAECKLENCKNKADQAEVELAQINDKIAKLERDLSQQQLVQPWTEQVPQTRTEELFVELTEAKLRAEEVEAELLQAQTSKAAVENEVAEAIAMQSRTEEAAQMQIEALSTHLIDLNESSMDAASAMLVDEDF